MSQAQMTAVKDLVDAIVMMRDYWSQVPHDIHVQLWQQVLDREADVADADIGENTFSPAQYETLGGLRTTLEPFRDDWDWEDVEAQNALWTPVSEATGKVDAAFEFGVFR